jgi:hypothetical protein
MAFGLDMPGPPADERAQRRVAAAQANLRRLNQAMRSLDDSTVYRCECGRLGCNVLIRLRPDEYGAVRAHARRFVVVPDHEVAEIEHVVERQGGHAVVEAHAPVAIEVAEATSPA